jgi:thioredoxin-like negative regulator of GroEL
MRGTRPKTVLIVTGIVLAFLAILVAKGTIVSESPAAGAAASGRPAASIEASASSRTTAHNDAVADYAAATKTGKPIYLLFHSLTCDPCVEISAIADKVVPGYEGKVVFVNAITDDASGQELSSRFSFQYIPTSFFIRADGTVADSFTGVLTEADMRAQLDKLIAQ